MRHSFPHFFYSEINYPITRKEQNENPFFQGFKTHFLVLTRVKFSSLNNTIKFINTKTRKRFFSIFQFFIIEK